MTKGDGVRKQNGQLLTNSSYILYESKRYATCKYVVGQVRPDKRRYNTKIYTGHAYILEHAYEWNMGSKCYISRINAGYHIQYNM